MDCHVLGNTASGSGGGIVGAETSGEVWVVNSVLRANSANNFGGGAYFEGVATVGGTATGDPCLDATLRVVMQNCLITCNQAPVSDRDGGGVYFAARSKGELRNSTFSRNSAARNGGAIKAQGACVDAYNAVLWGDTAQSGPEVHLGGSTVTIAYSVLQGGCAGVVIGVGGGTLNCVGQPNVLNSDPRFLDPDGANNLHCDADDDYRLNRDLASPGVDSGDNTKVAVDFVDVDRNGNTTEITPRDLAHRDRFFNDTLTTNTGNPPSDPDIVDMGAYETVRCTDSTQCQDPSTCFGNASCASNWCDIAWMTDCNRNLKEDFCEISEGAADCNSNGCPDNDEGECINSALVSSVYACDDSLPRTKGNVLRMTFKCAVPTGTGNPVRIQPLAASGGYGTDLASSFRFTWESGNTVLRIGEESAPNTPITVLSNQVWYGIREGLGWPRMGPFKRDYVSVRGDADNSKVTVFFDLNVIYGNIGPADGPDGIIGTADDDQERADIDASGVVNNFDINLAYGNVGSGAPTKPTGHACSP